MGKIIFGLTLFLVGAISGGAIIFGTHVAKAETDESEAMEYVVRMLDAQEAMGDELVYLQGLLAETDESEAQASVDRMWGPYMVVWDDLRELLDLLRQSQEANDPKASMSPTSGEVGSTVTVKGDNFEPSGSIDILFHGSTIATVRADSEGAFTGTITIPDLDAGTYTVTVGSLFLSFTITEPAPWPVPAWPGNLDPRIRTTLRSDTPEIKSSGDYYTRFSAAQYAENAAGNAHTNVSFTVNLEDWDSLNVGLLTTKNEIRWFALATGGQDENIRLECLRGTLAWDDIGEEDMTYRGCLGDSNDIVKLNSWHGVRYVRKDGYWDIRVEDENRKSYLVARLHSVAKNIVSASTDYLTSSPEIKGGFWQDMPYYRGSSRKMEKWPGSVGQTPNAAYFFGSRTCPDEAGIYDSISDQGGVWYTGKRTSEIGWYCQRNPLF